MTDIGSGDPDDMQSMVRFLIYSNEYDVEGLIAVVAGTPNGDRVCEELIHKQIDAYKQVLPNLKKHAEGFPSSAYLHSITKTGLSQRGMPFVGKGKHTDGTQLLIEVAKRDDNRPLWITLWGGATTLAQALYDLRESHDTIELNRIITKLRIYAISDQDDAGMWIRKEFPTLFYIVSPSRPYPDWWEYYRATWAGIAGDRFFRIGVGHCFDMVDNPWLKKNITEGHGALGELYPPSRFIMEGDTPSFLGLINNGLGWSLRPDYGGWGGRYQFYQASTETRKIWTNNMHSRDSVMSDNGKSEISDHATIWRWREHFQNDFAARMDWCVANKYKDANHNPIAVLNGDISKSVVYIPVKNGTSVKLSAEGTYDPDSNNYNVRWWIYQEAGNIKGAFLKHSTGNETEVIFPDNIVKGSLHVIMEVRDDGEPNLWSYRRAIITMNE